MTPTDLPYGTDDEREGLLAWLGSLRASVVRKVAGITDEQARWTPDAALLPLLGIVHHLTRVEWRWIDGGFMGAATERTEAEFRPGPELSLAAAVDAYRRQALVTDETARSLPLDTLCRRRAEKGTNLRWVLTHLIQETARHAGHADAVRELLDGVTGD